MDDRFLLLAAIFLPLLGAISMWVVAPLGKSALRYTALGVTVAALCLAMCVILRFPADGAGEFAVSDYPWLGGSALNIRFSVGLDGLGVWLFGLSALLMLTSVLVSWEAIEDRAPLFYAMLLLLEFGCLGVFAARDIILFYVFFEFTLIPLFFLIGIWGSEQRQYAAIKFFLFTLAGSVLTFLGLISIVLWTFRDQGIWTFSIPDISGLLKDGSPPLNLQVAIFLALLAGFAIKVPIFPLHTWLPLAHVQAPTAGSVFLAGILLKIGVYGFLRFSIPMLPEATALLMPYLLWFSVAGIVYGALVALAQSDMKRLIAYSSVSHLGYCTLGLFALNRLGVQGAALQMINHGISTGGLFAVVGLIYERYHTREIKELGGLAYRAPRLAFFMLVFTFSSIGLPGLNGFVGEFMVLLGMFQRAWGETSGWSSGFAQTALQLKIISVLSVSGVVLGAWYMLWLVQRVFFGPLKEPQEGPSQAPDCGAAASHSAVSDLKWREVIALTPLVVFVVWIGLWPNVFLQRMQPTLNEITDRVSSPVAERYEAAGGGDTRLTSRGETNRVR
jgi:NADH-quinone oxidoreductase subunit M